MQSVVTYIRNLLGWCDDEFGSRDNFKRERTDDDLSLDDNPPAHKRLKSLKKTTFPNVMSSNDLWNRDEKPRKNVRYIPIQREFSHPSTSTPNEIEKISRVHNVPIQLVTVAENGPSTPARKPRMHTPIRPVVIDDDDDDHEVTLVEKIPENNKKGPKVYILDDEDETDRQDDVIFVKKIATPPPSKPYKFFVSNDDEIDNKDTESYQFYKLSKVNERNSGVLSPRTYSRFKAPVGITKSYRKPTTTLPKWMQTVSSVKSSNLSNNRNKFLNGNLRTTLSEVFNLDEKRNYQELIRRVTGTSKPLATSKPIETINLADDSASFRLTQQAQKNALNEIKLFERGLLIDKENQSSKEYDPITVASINSSDSEVEIIPSESSSSSIRIDQVNSLKDSHKDKPVTGDDWLLNLDRKYRKKKHDTQEKLKEARRESDIISKVNSEQKIAHLEHKLKYELSIPESLFEEPQPTVELPELTPEQEKLVNRSIGPGPPGQLLVEKFNLRIHRRDLQTLSGLNWLNDEIINFYMNLLMQRSEERKDLPKVYATNTFFYPKLMQSGQAGLRRWTRKVDIFAHDLMVIPVHLGVHWCLSLIDFRDKKISYLDSMGGKNQACLNALRQYLKDEHQDKKGKSFDDSGWKAECLKDIPQQMNGSDCGMFACTFAEFSSRNAPYTFNQSHMPYLRRKAALEILTGKLLL